MPYCRMADKQQYIFNLVSSYLRKIAYVRATFISMPCPYLTSLRALSLSPVVLVNDGDATGYNPLAEQVS